MADTDLPFVPASTPKASPRYARRRVRYWMGRMGITAPWKVSVGIRDCRKGTAGLCDPEDPNVYAQMEPQAQYLRGTLLLDLWHPSFEEGLDECIRHELLHLMVHAYTGAAVHHAGANKAAVAVLEDLEDALVSRLATMPIWGDDEA